jgi:nucleotide-binding universal stress UspA family protein
VINNYIAVGVDGSSAARGALLWAVDECQIRQRMFVIVHAPDAKDAVLMSAGVSRLHSLDEVGEYLLRDAASAASARQPSVAVTSRLSHSAPAEALTELSEQADLAVVGSRGRGSSVVSSVVGSVSDRVAAHAHCPVVIVPGIGPHAGLARVVVGVAATRAGRLALDLAFEEAQLRGATLVAVLAMRDQQAEASPAESFGVRAASGGAVLLDELASAAAAYPDVIAEPLVSDSDPASALLDATPGADLVVVGCHSDDRWSTRLGPVPAAIAQRAPCPVVVVGHRRHASAAFADVLVTDFA